MGQTELLAAGSLPLKSDVSVGLRTIASEIRGGEEWL